MAINPEIALGFRPPQLAPLPNIQSPLDRYQKMLTLRHLMQQGQMGQMNIEQTGLENEALRRTAQDEQSLGSWMRQNQGRPDLTASEIVANHPNPTGLKVATAWSAQQKANMEAQSAVITNRLNTLKAIDREMQGITDNPTKAAALSNAVTNKWMTGEQAAPYLSMDVTDPKWKDFTTRIQSQTMDGTQRAEFAAAEIKARIARNTEASTTAGTIAEGDKKVLDAAQAQRASDAARVAAAFDLSPEAGAAVLRTLAQDPNRFAPFKDVTTAAQARNVGLTAEQQAAGARAAEPGATQREFQELFLPGYLQEKGVTGKPTAQQVKEAYTQFQESRRPYIAPGAVSPEREAQQIRITQAGQEGPQAVRAETRAQAIGTQWQQSSKLLERYRVAASGYDSVKQMLGGGGPQDLAVIYGFAKAMDPESVVRESEVENAMKTGNIFRGALAKFNGLWDPRGGFLSPQVKQDFLSAIKTRMESTRKQVFAEHGEIKRQQEVISPGSSEALYNPRVLDPEDFKSKDLKGTSTDDLLRQLLDKRK